MSIKYTYQKLSDSGSFASPGGKFVNHAATRDHIAWVFEDWLHWHGRVGSDERDAFFLIWRGDLADVTDQYPDFELRMGPRGGMRWTRL